MPAAVEDAVMRSLAKRPEDRFGSAREMRKHLESALRDSDLGLVETQRLAREVLGDLRPAAPDGDVATTAPLPGVDARRRISVAGPLANELEPEARRRRRSARPWIALAAVVLVSAGAVVAVAVQRAGRYRATVAINGIALTRGTTIGKLVVETDGAVEPEELARLYRSTLDALRLYATNSRLGSKVQIPDPVDVLLGVPAAALCESSAYLDHQAPPHCATALSATAIGARGTHRLMVVSDRAQLIPALRKGVAQAACDFSPAEDNKLVREICDVASRFAESSN
jgi:hypothetical protein